ncbi:MAG: response regulator transcription factor [Melioribacteraceae bacterium]|nr:response regulator transcription factor [Melioribacteraceae bacterium]
MPKQDKRIKILLADDHSLVREGIGSILENNECVRVVASASNGAEAVEKFFEFSPDLVLMDISMPEMNGFEALKRMREKQNDVKVIFLTMHESEEYLYQAIKFGAKGLITKSSLKTDLDMVISNVFSDKNYFGEEFDDEKIDVILKKYDLMMDTTHQPDITLAPRERKILQLLSEGLTSHEMAEHLKIGKRTIDSHRQNIMAKLNIKSLPELIKTAIQYANIKNNLG